MADEYKPSTCGASGFSRLPLDPARCKAGVFGKERWSSYSQCARKAGDSGWCKQHDPEAVGARAKAAADKFEADGRRYAMGFYGERFMAALVAIRDGDNDPRGTAAKALDDCRYAPGSAPTPLLKDRSL